MLGLALSRRPAPRRLLCRNSTPRYAKSSTARTFRRGSRTWASRDFPARLRSWQYSSRFSSACGKRWSRTPTSSRPMTALGLGCAKTPARAPHVEISLINCISESQIILHARGSMPCWRIVFSTFRGCMSFYTARVISVGSIRCRRSPHVRFASESGRKAPAPVLPRDDPPCSHALVNQPGEEVGVDDEVAPLSVEGSGRLCCDRLVSRSSLPFERGHVLPDCDQHVAEFLEFASVADGLPVSWNDDGLVRRCRKVSVGCRDHAVDAAARRIVDERINTVPIR